jgi:hypothetical protein
MDSWILSLSLSFSHPLILALRILVKKSPAALIVATNLRAGY